MHGPRPPTTWTGHQNPAQPYGALQPGRTYEVRTAFVDYDGSAHPVGERWVFLGYNYLPYDDGLSLFVSLDGRAEWHIRLQDRPDEQGAIVQGLDDVYLVEAVVPIDAPVVATAIPKISELRPRGARTWATLVRLIGLGGAGKVGREALRAALPVGSPTSAVRALLGEPTGRIELFSDGPEVSTWLYRPAIFGTERTQAELACDFDSQNRLIRLRWL